MKLEATKLFLIAHPVVEYNSVVAIGDQLAGVRGVKGQSTLIPVISAENCLTERLLRFNSPLPHTQNLTHTHTHTHTHG